MSKKKQKSMTDPLSGDLLANIQLQLKARAEGWRNASNDPYNIANAVQVTLLEVANSINAVIKPKPTKE